MKLSTALTAIALLVANGNLAMAFVPASSAFGKVRTTTMITSLFLEPLAKEYDWTAYLDEDNTGLVYYFNEKTGESLWEPPTSSFPPIRLPAEKRKIAIQKQQEYAAANKVLQEEQEEKKGFFASVFSSTGGEQEQEAVKEEEPKQEEPNWFDFGSTTKTTVDISERPKAADRPVMVEEKKKEPQKEESTGGFFNVFGSTAQKEEKKVEQKEEPAPVNGEAAVEQEKKSFFLSGLKNRLLADKPAAVEEEEPTQVLEPEKVDEEPKRRFGLGIMNVIKRAPQEVEITPRKVIEIDMGSYVLPHPAKISWGGEDAAFVKGKTFGVFDGVSGAEKLDGIPLYSKTLAQELQVMVGEDGLNTKEITSVLTEAAEFADKAATGASTAVVGSITPDGYLRVLNLGDSVCLVVRDNAIKARTREIVHYFDCPYQLAEDSPDRPNDGTKLNVEVLPGDLILMGSDGIFDNLNDNMILQALEEAGPNLPPSILARRIVDLSRKVSLDTEADTPYAKVAKRNGDPDYKSGKGGKVDDASLVVVRCT